MKKVRFTLKTQLDFQTFEQFWSYYLLQHQNSTSRALHYLGSLIGPLCAYYIWSHHLHWSLFLICWAPAYLLSWIGHFVFEKNVPETFSHPVWSLLAGLKMFYLFLSGKIEEEFKK